MASMGAGVLCCSQNDCHGSLETQTAVIDAECQTLIQQEQMMLFDAFCSYGFQREESFLAPEFCSFDLFCTSAFFRIGSQGI